MLANKFKPLAVCALLMMSAAAFSLDRGGVGNMRLHQRSAGRSKIFSRSLLLMSASNDDVNFTDEELQKMDDLIISLSLEPTDERRRDRLQSIFDEELAKPNGAPQHFSNLFSHTLIIVGDRVKLEAQEYAAELTAKAEEEEAEAVESADERNQTKDAEPFAQQRQLWGLVDMLIQSKTIMKRASGDLGNKGTFQ